jgi:hypothetical protein
MKAKMYSANSNTRLHKTIDEFYVSNEGIKNLRKTDIIHDEEFMSMVQKNIEVFMVKIKEFRLAEKMTCIFFAALFLWLQVNADDLDIQRKGRRSRSRGRRRNETENPFVYDSDN